VSPNTGCPTIRPKCNKEGNRKYLEPHDKNITYMLNTQVTVLPVLTETTGNISKALAELLNVVPSIHSIKTLQKTVLLGQILCF
jgi:hypothetical protein